MEGKPPLETFPQIGTIEDPALFCAERTLLLSYELAPVGGGGNAILFFSDVVYFEQNPNNVHEGLRQSVYPVRAWDFTEVFGSDRIKRWGHTPRRFWTISFNDVMVEVVFAKVRLVHEARYEVSPPAALLDFLAKHDLNDFAAS